MSGDVDPEDKTEEPTEKRLHDAVERGEVAFSREAPLFASLSATLLVLIFVIPARAEALLTALVGIIDDPAGWRIERGEDVLALAEPSRDASHAFPSADGDSSHGRGRSRFRRPEPATHRARQNLARRLAHLAAQGREPRVRRSRLDGVPEEPHQARRGDCGRDDDADRPEGRTAHGDGRRPGHAACSACSTSAVKTVAAVLVATVAVAAADLAWSRILWRRDHRMSKQEVKEELRQAEGDRMIKARLRSLRLDRSRKRMLSAVPRATMVVVNPTHYAVAMRYVRAEGGAPIVVAKGADFIALKIRSIAEENAIPVVEDKPLARSLYAAVDVDRPIPAEFYRAVAEIVHLIQQRKGQWAQRRQ